MVSNEHTKFVSEWASENGAAAEVTRGGHIKVTLKNGSVVITSQTPRSARRARSNFLAMVRRSSG